MKEGGPIYTLETKLLEEHTAAESHMTANGDLPLTQMVWDLEMHMWFKLLTLIYCGICPLHDIV